MRFRRIFAAGILTIPSIAALSSVECDAYTEPPENPENAIKFLYGVLSSIYDPRTPPPSAPIPVKAPTDLYEYVIALKLQCLEQPIDLLKTLVQIDEVKIERAKAHSHSNPADDPNEENRVSIQRFQYMNDDIAVDFLNRLSTLLYQYDQALIVAHEEWPEQQLARLGAIKSAFENFYKKLDSVIGKARYAGVSLDMKRKELGLEELKAIVADPEMVY
ncbi:hypothetical protein TWF694_011541 [Orbilia ellipsospora]|uniref:Uncharacterized protein n=1 Tax=Orbilia ellipsospora TaxID=2528407 RepID=A0AAV9X6M2_9PEZI